MKRILNEFNISADRKDLPSKLGLTTSSSIKYEDDDDNTLVNNKRVFFQSFTSPSFGLQMSSE